jgi:ABC-type Fe3+ transport system permease subunit
MVNLFTLILLTLDFILFLLSFIYIILDIKNYKANRYDDLETTKLPKPSSRSLMFSLLALFTAVILSLGI